MQPGRHLGRLIQGIAHERDAGRALTRICETALKLPLADSAMVAVMKNEAGVLEITYGAGAQFDAGIGGFEIVVDVGDGLGIIPYVAATAESVLTGNVLQHPHYRLRNPSTRSEIAVPVIDEYGRVRAVLNIESDSEDAFGEEDLEDASSLAALTGMVLDRQEEDARVEALIQVGRSMETVVAETDLIERVMRVAQEILGFQACSLFLYDQALDAYVLRGSVSRLKEQIGQIFYHAGEGCTGWVCETGRPVLLNNPQSDSRWRGRYVEFPSEEIASFLAVPIVSRGHCSGCLRLLRRQPENRYLDVRYTESDLRILEAIAEQFAVGLDNLRSLERVVRSERMIAWGELSAKSSHMIGNRVFALRGDVNELGYQLGRKETNLSVIRELQHSLEINVTRVEEILQEFRDFITATKIELAPGDLNAFVEETVREIFPRRSKAKLDLKLADDLPKVRFDARKLRRAISELLENALVFDPTGIIKVQTTKVQQNRTVWAGIEVSDTGPGIPHEQKTLIFQPFFSGRVKGMGLGLSIVKGIVDAHGGGIWEQGELGKGAKFMILLPARDRP